MSDEERTQVTQADAYATSNPAEGSAAASKTPRKWPIVVSVIAIFLAVFFVAFLHLHEEPRFCNSFCHQPMDKYVEGYYSEDVSLGASVHENAGVTCLGCHWPQAKMLDLVHEVICWATDSFTDPLPDHSKDIYGEDGKLEAESLVSDEFCGRCHNGTDAKTKEEATSGWMYDPHALSAETLAAIDGTGMATAMHAGSGIFKLDADGNMIVDENGNYVTNCGSCHTIHKSSTLACAECHSDYFNAENGNLPEGWVIPTDSRAAMATSLGMMDPHSLVGTDTFTMFSEFHATAGANGAITCTDCHKANGENVFVCSQCHSDTYGEFTSTLSGWAVPSDKRAAMAEEMGMLDPHALIAMPAFEEVQFHQTAGADGGMITCTDCHTASGENVFVCSQCHASDFATLSERLAGEGWTIPEGMDIPMMGAPEAEVEETTEAAADEAATDEAAEEAAAPAGDVTYADGTYEATGKGIGGDVPVTVTIEGGVITSVEIGENGETQGIGSKAIEELPSLIVEANGIAGVDGVSGASVTSGAIFSAMEDILAQAAA